MLASARTAREGVIVGLELRMHRVTRAGTGPSVGSRPSDTTPAQRPLGRRQPLANPAACRASPSHGKRVSPNRTTRAFGVTSLLDMAESPTAQSGGLSVDLERSQAAVTELTMVREQLKGLRQEAAELGRQAVDGRTANDLVSVDASMMFAERADGGPGSLALALDAGIAHVEGLIKQMSSDLERYRNVDEAGASGFAHS